MIKEEWKEPVPRFRGTDQASSLVPTASGFRNAHTKESSVMAKMMSRLFAGKEYEFRISSAVNLPASGAGLVSSVITNITLSSQADFSALSSVFSEFFVTKFHLRYQPVSRYNYPLTGVTATSVANVPIGVAALQHTQPAYTSLSELTNNNGYQLYSTGDPWQFEWVNDERKSSDVVPTPLTTVATQAWCMVQNAANYQGQVQFQSNAVPPPVTPSAVLGVIAVDWIVSFRVRL
jgi:hypothetical protein